MEVYLNIAETGIGTYGVNAGALRYFDRDASRLSRTEAARIAAVLPLPKQRGAVAPKGFTRRYGNSIATRIGIVARDGLDACVYDGATVAVPAADPEPKARPAERPTPRPKAAPMEPLPGEQYEGEAVADDAPAADPTEAEPEPAAVEESELNGI